MHAATAHSAGHLTLRVCMHVCMPITAQRACSCTMDDRVHV